MTTITAARARPVKGVNPIIKRTSPTIKIISRLSNFNKTKETKYS